MRRSNEGWSAACEGDESTSDELVDAIRGAVGSERGEALLIGVEHNAALEQWILETAAQILGETAD